METEETVNSQEVTTTRTEKNNETIQPIEVDGILKRSRKFDENFVFDLEVLSFALFVRLVLYVIIPLAISQLYPSWFFVYTSTLCSLYSALDLLCWPSSSSSSERVRKVKFGPGTKFHRLPRPRSRKQRMANQVPTISEQQQQTLNQQQLKGLQVFHSHMAKMNGNQVEMKSETVEEACCNNTNALSSSPKFIGGDAPMARIRMAL